MVRELESRGPAAASNGARRRAKVRQSGEVDPGGEGCAAENGEGGGSILRDCGGKPASLGNKARTHGLPIASTEAAEDHAHEPRCSFAAPANLSCGASTAGRAAPRDPCSSRKRPSSRRRSPARARGNRRARGAPAAACPSLFRQYKRISTQDYRDGRKDNSRCKLRDLFYFWCGLLLAWRRCQRRLLGWLRR